MKTTSGGERVDITDLLNVPAPVDGVIDVAASEVKKEIVQECLDASKGACVELSPYHPSIRTVATRKGLTYTLREGRSLADMEEGESHEGDGNPWEPKLTVFGGSSAFFSIGVDK